MALQAFSRIAAGDFKAELTGIMAQQRTLKERNATNAEAANKRQQVAEVTTSASEELSAQIEESSHGAEKQSKRIAETAEAMP